VIADRVKEFSTTTGTGNFTLTGAVTGFEGFNTAFGIGPSFDYCIESIDSATGAPNGAWEIGSGHLSGATTLVRDTVRQSSNADALVAFGTGTKNVFCTLPASVIVALQAAIDAKVAKAGDTMTGDLLISKASPQFILDATSGLAIVNFIRNSVQRWAIYLNADAGSNTGSDIVFNRYNDAGVGIDTPITISRSTGTISVKALASAGVVNAGTTVQAAGGTFYFQDGAKFLAHDGSTHFTFSDSGVSLGWGFNGRAGYGGAFDGSNHNIHWTGAVNNLWVDATNMGAIQVACDYRIKKDVAPLASTWDAVKALKPIAYTQAEFTPPVEKIEHAKRVAAAREGDAATIVPPLQPMFHADAIKRWGFLAHELQETLLPSAATGEKDSPTEVQSPNLMAISAALTRALQEAMARIEVLEGAASGG
jgi:hypothetical protein